MSLSDLFEYLERNPSQVERTLPLLKETLRSSRPQENLYRGLILSLKIPNRALGCLLLQFMNRSEFDDYFHEDQDDLFIEAIAQLLRFYGAKRVKELREGIEIFYDFLRRYHGVSKFSSGSLEYLQGYFRTIEGFPNEEIKSIFAEILETYGT